MMSWYLQRDGQRYGPLDLAQLRSAAPGQLPGDLVWRDGLPGWVSPGQLQELAAPTGWSPQAGTGPVAPAAAPGRTRSRAAVIGGLVGSLVLVVLVGAMIVAVAGVPAGIRYLGIMSLLAFIGGTTMTALSFRRWRALRPRAIVVAALLPILVTVVQLVLASGGRLAALTIGLPIGLALGLLWGGTTRVEVTRDGLRMAGTVPAFVAWAALLSLVQLLRLVGAGEPAVLLVVVVAQSAAFAGANLTILVTSRAAVRTA